MVLDLALVKLEEELKCNMKVVELDDNPDFEVISYTWSDPLTYYRYEEDVMSQEEWYKSTYEIFIDDQPGQ